MVARAGQWVGLRVRELLLDEVEASYKRKQVIVEPLNNRHITL